MNYLLKIIIFLFCLIVPALADNDKHISVNILSKHIRLINEGATGNLLFKFPDGTIIEERTAGSCFEAGHLLLTAKTGKWIFDFGNRNISDAYIMASHPKKGQTFTGLGNASEQWGQ